MMSAATKVSEPPFPSHGADLETAHSVLDGDEAAFLKLVERCHVGMMRVARVYSGNDAVAEEVVQEAWLAILKALPTYAGRSALKTWMLRIVGNVAKKRRVKEARWVPFSAFDDEDGPTMTAQQFLETSQRWAGHWATPAQTWTDDIVMSRQTIEIAHAAIDALPPNQRDVILLHDVDGFESDEVCDALGVSGANQRVLLHRARAKVRAAIEAHVEAKPGVAR